LSREVKKYKKLGSKPNPVLLYLCQLVEEYYTKLMDKYPDGKMDVSDFIGKLQL
jgi:hypothetical protein